MKMKLFFVVSITFMLAGCGKTLSDDFEVTTIYVYKNSTDKQISIESYLEGKNTEEPVLDISFSILSQGEYILEITRFGMSYPFQKKSSDKRSHLVISNGERQFTQFFDAKENYFKKPLYHTSRYEKSEDNDTYIFTYTFTDEDFKDAKPVEQ